MVLSSRNFCPRAQNRFTELVQLFQGGHGLPLIRHCEPEDQSLKRHKRRAVQCDMLGSAPRYWYYDIAETSQPTVCTIRYKDNRKIETPGLPEGCHNFPIRVGIGQCQNRIAFV